MLRAFFNIQGGMKMNKLWVVMVVLVWGLGGSLSADKQPFPDFIIKPDVKKKKLSKNERKELIGEKSRELMHMLISSMRVAGGLHGQPGRAWQGCNDLSCLTISSFHERLGELQADGARVQKQISLIIERLIEDQKPFKHARLGALEKIDTLLDGVLLEVRDIKKKLKKSRGDRQGEPEKVAKDVDLKKIIDETILLYASLAKRMHAVHKRLAGAQELQVL